MTVTILRPPVPETSSTPLTLETVTTPTWPAPAGQPEPPAPGPRRPWTSVLARGWAAHLGGRWPWALAAAWAAVFVVEPLLVPEPAEGATEPAWVVALSLTWLALLGAVLVGAVARRRTALHASLAGSVLSLGLVVACPVSGHHEWAAWWAADLALWLGVTALTVEGLRRTAPAAPRPLG